METYNGHVRTPNDAIVLFEACRIGLLPRVQRRLSEKERQSIKSGSVFVWDEREAGMRRWTDGKSWSASRVSGSFLTYREMEGKRSGNTVERNANRDGVQGQDGDSDGGPDGYRYKPDGLMKQSFSIKTQQGQHLHLISYFSRSTATASNLMQPTTDPQLRHIRPEKGMYPDSTVHEQSSIPAVTRGPMHSPGYPSAPPQGSPYARPLPYNYGPPTWAPPSPMHTPPPHNGYPPYGQHGQSPYYHGQPPMQAMHYPPPPNPAYGAPPPGTPYERPPPPMNNAGIPPHPAQYTPSPAPNGYPSNHMGQQPPPQYHHGYPFPPTQGPQHEQGPAPYPPAHPPHHGYDPRPAHDMCHAPHQEPGGLARDQRQDSHHGGVVPPPHHLHREHQHQHHHQHQQPPPPSSQAAAPPPAPSSGQTIPSISAMLNSGSEPASSTGNRSPGGTLRAGLQDIPSHKLGFEANRDMQALRNLDKTTFKQY